MAEYTLAASGVIRSSDGARIPEDPKNADWVDYQRWLLDGNTPDPFVPPPVKTPADRIRESVTSNAFARALIRRIADKEGVPPAQVVQELVDRI